MTITTNCSIEPVAVNGSPLKSINQFYNKELARIKSDLKVKHNADWSKALQKLTTKRNNKVNDYKDQTQYPTVLRIINTLTFKNKVPIEYTYRSISNSKTYYSDKPVYVLYGIRKTFWTQEFPAQ